MPKGLTPINFQANGLQFVSLLWLDHAKGAAIIKLKDQEGAIQHRLGLMEGRSIHSMIIDACQNSSEVDLEGMFMFLEEE